MRWFVDTAMSTLCGWLFGARAVLILGWEMSREWRGFISAFSTSSSRHVCLVRSWFICYFIVIFLGLFFVEALFIGNLFIYFQGLLLQNSNSDRYKVQYFFSFCNETTDQRPCLSTFPCLINGFISLVNISLQHVCAMGNEKSRRKKGDEK